MKNICVLGAGQAGLSFADYLKSKAADYKIALIDKRQYYFSRQALTVDFCAKNSFELEGWAGERGIDFICSQAQRINLKTKKIFFKEGLALEFDSLVIAAGVKSKDLAIKGMHKEGAFYFSDIDPVKLRGIVKLSDEMVVYAATILGIKLAFLLKSLGKETTVIAGNLDFLAYDKERVIDCLRGRGIELYLNSTVEEVIGDGAVKAVKIDPLKILSAQMIFVDSGFEANNDFFEEGVRSNNNFLTEYEGVYFLGDIVHADIGSEYFFINNSQEVKTQSELLVDFLIDGEVRCFERQSPSMGDKQLVLDEILNTQYARR